MIRASLLFPLLVLATGCLQAPVVRPVSDATTETSTVIETRGPTPIRAHRVDGGLRFQGVAGQVLRNGQLLIAGGGFRLALYRSENEGVSFLPLRVPEVSGLTPNIALIEGWPVVAYAAFHFADGQRRMDGVRLLHTVHQDGRWLNPQPVVITDTGVDPYLLPLASGRTLCFVILEDSNLGVFASDDAGASWFPLAKPLHQADARLEDGRAILLPDGTILYAFEREVEEYEPSTIEVIRSVDSGLTWSSPQPLWHPPVPADVEPGGFVQHPSGALLFFVSSDEDASDGASSYTGARVRALVSHDRGATWTMKGPVVEEPDQIVFHPFPRAQGGVGLLTIRHWLDGDRAMAVYHLDANDVARLVARPDFNARRRPHDPH